MSGLPDLIAVLTKIACDIRRTDASAVDSEGDDDDDGASRAIASLTKSLNSVDQSVSGSRVLDAALSLMCLKTTQVCRARVELLFQTIVTVLNSSDSCNVLRLGRGAPDLLQVGSSITFRESAGVIKVITNVLESLPMESGLSQNLLHAVFKAVVNSSEYKVPFSTIAYDGGEIKARNIDIRNAISKLMCFLPDDGYPSCQKTPLRLFFWYLDPLLLKHDISEVLKEAMQRPFLSLKREMYNRMTWRTVIICLVTSPTMFKQARSLLHSWFLKTGFPFIMEFQIVAVSSLLDMISRPMSWGVPMELGLKYSHSHAYFPSQCHQLLGVLNGYITCKSFLAMIHQIKIAVAQIMEPIFHPNKCHSSHATLGHEAILDVIGENSTWAMLMNFPTWFYFASALLFFDKDWNTYFSNDIAAKIDVESVNENELVEAAILCLSWVMSPCSKGNLDRLAEHFHKTSRSWSTVSTQTSSHEKCSSIGTHKKGAVSCNKKLRIQKACNDKFKLVATKNSFSSLARWLRKFDGFVAQSKMKSFLSHESSDSFAETELMSRRSKLFTQIPLGILISCPNFLKDKECELLLYYATTGDISHFSDVHTDADEHHERDFSLPSGTEGRKWGLDGTRLVFSFSDIIEDMSAMLFDCENTRLDYICLLKGKICGYLLRCVKEFLNIYVPNLGEHRGSVDLLDLVKRLTMWKQQGREVFDGCEEFDDFVNGLATKVLLLKEKDEH